MDKTQLRRRRILLIGATSVASMTGCVNDIMGDKKIEEDPRVDEPPHEIVPPTSDPDEEWNDEYLGVNMAQRPSLDFKEVPFWLDNSLDDQAFQQYRVGIAHDEESLSELIALESMDEEDRQAAEATNFDDWLVVGIRSGHVSTSVNHRWARVEETDIGVHLHGYYTDPQEELEESGPRVSVLKIERPNDLTERETPVARVSLTINESQRVHFNSTEGVIEL